jgi:hypothetical protein
MFETCRRRQEVNSNNLKSMHLLVTFHNSLVTLSCMFNAPIFFFGWKYYTDLQLSLFFLKVVALRRSVVGCHSYRPVSERQCTSPCGLLSCEFINCHRGAFEVSVQNWGVASCHCLIFILYVHFGPWRWDHHDASKRLVPVTQWRSDTS